MASRQSAFAKRRRLNNSTSSPANSTAPSSTTSIASESEIVTTVKKAASQKRGKAVVELELPNLNDVDDANTFGALVDDEIVSFSHSREIEAINGRDVKVRLTQNQVCWSGCRIWD